MYPIPVTQEEAMTIHKTIAIMHKLTKEMLDFKKIKEKRMANRLERINNDIGVWC